MSNIVEAEYQVIQERTLPVIASEILQIEENACRVAMDAAIRIGQRLKEAKGIAGHGGWAQWCDENLNYSQKKAERFMKIYEEYGDENSPYLKSTTLSKLSISKALSLLDIPKNEVKTFTETHDIEALSVRELEEEIKKLKANNEEAEERALEATNLALSFEKQLDELKASGADPEKIADLEVKLEKLENKNKKLTEDLKAEKESKEKAIAEVLDKEKEQLQKQAEDAAAAQLQEAEKENKELEEKLERLAKRIENSANENTLVFKLRVDQLQEVFAECMACAEAETDPEMQGKMKNALSAVMDNLRGGM